MNKKLFMMALCIVGHSGYAVESTPTQQNANHLIEKKLDDAIQQARNIKAQVLASKTLDELRAFHMPLMMLFDAVHEYDPGLDAKHREFLDRRDDVSNTLRKKIDSWKQKAWEGLTREQQDQEKKKVDDAISNLMHQRSISQNPDEFVEREKEGSNSMRDSYGDYLYSSVPEMKEKYQEYRDAAYYWFNSFDNERLEQWLALTDEQRGQEKKKVDDAMQKVRNIEGQVLKNQDLTSQALRELGRQLNAVEDSRYQSQYYLVPAMDNKLDRLLESARQSLNEARNGWMPVKQTLEEQKLDQANDEE